MAAIMCDTSSAIEMSIGGGSYGKLCATAAIMEEIERHRGVYKAGKKEISDRVYSSFVTMNSSSRPDYDSVRYDAYWAWKRGCSEKKVKTDPISAPDLGLVTEAIMQARRGMDIEVLTEDEHVSGTIRQMLNSEKYRRLGCRIKVRSVAA